MSRLKTIAYIMQIYPFRSETFISREIDAMRKAGVTVITLANQRPIEDALIRHPTYYIHPLTLPRILIIFFVHFWWLMRAPRAYLTCLHLLTQEESCDLSIWLRNFKHFSGAVYLAYMMRGHGIDHIHAHYTINAATMALFTSTLLTVPFSMTAHNIFFTDRTLLKVKLQRAQTIVCISEYSRATILSDYHMIAYLAEKMPIVHCGVHPDHFAIERHPTLSPITIMTACQLVERKGVHYLIEACKYLVDAGYDMRCVIAGDGEEAQALKKLADEHGIQERIQWIGAYTQDTLLALFSDASVFVLPCVIAEDGDRDGIPVVLMEAMAAGVPVISTPVSGIPELIQSGISGTLVPERSAEALAEAIIQYIEHANDFEVQIASARMTIMQDFNLDKSVAQLITLFSAK